jgi:hypothetical protein
VRCAAGAGSRQLEPAGSRAGAVGGPPAPTESRGEAREWRTARVPFVFQKVGLLIIKPQAMLSGDLREVGTMSTKSKRPAKKVVSKKGASQKRSGMSAVERLALQDVLASAAMSAVQRRVLQDVLASGEFRATTSWPSKEQVEGWDPTAFDVPGNFEAFCIKYRIWPWNRGPHARPFQCVKCEPKNEPVYYKDAEGHTKVAARRNDYYLAQECR